MLLWLQIGAFLFCARHPIFSHGKEIKAAMANDYCAELRYDVKNMYKTSGGSTVKIHRRNGSYATTRDCICISGVEV